MDSSSGGGNGDKDGDSEATSSLHDHSDLLIPNPSFSSPPPPSVSSTSSSMMMNITSPSSIDHDLQKQMDCQMTSPQQAMSFGGGDSSTVGQMDYAISSSEQGQPNGSPPNVVVDDSPLQPCMDRNKESLKVKLQLRRPMNQLVEQGILPPPKTPAAFAGQRVRLERARMGDLLKAKIQQRPARQELIRQHILEDTDSRVAPSLAEKQRMLKRARLADSLNDHLIHRPGPLELVQKNILHAPDADIEKAIKEGIVSFKATSEGHVPGPSLPNKYTVNEDDSSSDISSPAGTPDTSSSGHTTEANTPITKQSSDPSISLPPPVSANDTCEVSLQPAKTNKSETVPQPPPPPPPPLPPPPPQLILTTSAIPTPPAQVQHIATPTAIFQVTAPATVIPPPPPLPTINHISQATPQTIVLSDGAVRDLLPQLQSAGFQLAAAHVQKPPSQSSSSSTLGKTRSSKKSSKSKSQPKARTIKFHEYKGPSSLQHKGGSSSINSSSLSSQSKAESSYELLLKQQQLFLQWQLEWQHKYPQILLPAAPKVPQSSQAGASGGVNATKTLSSFPVTAIPASLCTTLINSNNQQSSQQPTITLAASTVNNGNANPKTIPVTIASKVTEIAPKPPSSTNNDSNITDPKSVSSDIAVPSPASSTCSSTTEKVSVKPLNLSNISEWKVNDLKAELKKRSLPVSGSKSQLVDRLKAAAAKESSSEAKGNPPASIKMEVMSGDENSSEAMMDTSGGNNDDKSGVNSPGTPQQTSATAPPPTTAILIGAAPPNATASSEGTNIISLADLVSGKFNGVPISLQSILSLLGMSAITNVNNNVEASNMVGNNNPAADNNLKNVTSSGVSPVSQTPAKVMSQLPISTLVSTAAKAASAAVGNNNGPGNKTIDESKNLEQQKQILELQKEVALSQQKLQQLAQQKDPKNGGPQEHRQVLRQHIQQKQKIQSQLQNLIQLQTQQAEQKKQQEQAQAQTQLVLIRSGTNNADTGVGRQISLPNNVLPVTIVNPTHQQPQQVNMNNHQQHQWLQQHHENTGKGAGGNINFDDLVRTVDTKEIPKLESQTKSQMVDDVLEILIRNGELPPSAAQDPHSKASIPQGSSGGSQDVAVSQSNNDSIHPPPPPPPPLPPPSFSVMLPTTIPFSRHQTTNNTDFLTFNAAGAPRTEENLSKDAQEILRICEDLSNFGKSREAEAAAAAAAAAAGMKLENSDNNNTSVQSMDCGFFSRNGSHTGSLGTDNKNFDLSTSNADSMDIGFNDTHSVSLHSSNANSKAQMVNHHQNHFANSPFDSMTFSFGHQQNTNASLKSHAGDHQQQDDHDHPFENVDELLPDIPSSLDMQMETDYSWLDRLDTLLPDSGSSNAASSPNVSAANIFQNIDHHHPQQAQQHQPDIGAKKHQNNMLNHNNNFSNSANHINTSLFSAIMDESNNQHQNHHGQQRDPLLSSRSFATGLMMGTLPFREQLHHNSFLFGNNSSNLNPTTGLLFHNPPSSVGSTSSSATLMDTDFDEMSSTCHNTKKSENNIIIGSSNNVIMPEMPSTTTNNITTPITTSSINDNFLWDF